MSAKSPSFFFIVLISFLVSVYAVEISVENFAGHHSTISPPLSVICLALMACFFSWRQVLFATPFFALTSYYLLNGIALFPSMRAVSVLLGGALAAWIAFQREQGIRRSSEISIILQNLPVPWVLSDASGNICLASSEALTILCSSSLSDIIGSSYFSFFSPMDGKGVFIQRYLDVLSHNSSPITLDLTLSRNSSQIVHATLSRIHLPQGPRLLTVFE